MSGSPCRQRRALERTIDHDTRNTPLGRVEDLTSTPEPNLPPSRTRSESHATTRRNRRGSVASNFASRRHGTIDILDTDIARITRRSSYSPVTTNYHPSHLENPAIQVTHDRVSTARDEMILGRWHCCECRRGHAVYRIGEGQHPLSILSCMCPHRSCKNCTFQGDIKRFAPMYDVEGLALMPTAGHRDEDIHMGVVCQACGLSWQAEKIEAPNRCRSFTRRFSILPKKVNPMPSLRHARSMIHLRLPRDPLSEDARPGTSLSTSRSFLDLRSVSDTQAREPKPNPEEQARGVQVRFYGIECTCGGVTDERSVCYVFFGLPKAKSSDEGHRKMGHEIVRPAEPSYLPELRRKGYGTPTLHLVGGPHPSPLMSNAAQELEHL